MGIRWSLCVVRGRSMLPTLRDGDRLLVRAPRALRVPRAPSAPGAPRLPPAAGSLVIVRLPGGRPVSVKRLVGRADGGWWVERDNPAEGVDSWLVGALADDDLLGVVVARLWPRPRWLGAHAREGLRG